MENRYYWTLVIGQVAAALATTTTRQSLFNYGLPNNVLTLCIVLELVLAIVVVEVPYVSTIFKTTNLGPRQLIISAIGAFLLITSFEELRKSIVRSHEEKKNRIHMERRNAKLPIAIQDSVDQENEKVRPAICCNKFSSPGVLGS